MYVLSASMELRSARELRDSCCRAVAQEGCVCEVRYGQFALRYAHGPQCAGYLEQSWEARRLLQAAVHTH